MSFASNRLPVAARRAIACLAAFASAATWADGGLDASFNGGFAFADWVSTASRPMHLVVNASGRVVVTTTVRESGGNNTMFAAARFRTDGTLDPAFGYLGLRTLEFDLVDEGFDLLHGARALPGGALMLLGTAEVPGNAYAPAMARLTAAGNADPNFGANGRRVITTAPWPLSNVDLPLVAHQPDGKYLFAGWCNDCPAPRAAVVLRVDAEGNPDAAFGDGGWASLAVPWPSRFTSIAVDRAGRIALAGFDGELSNTPHVPVVARFLGDGTPDISFGVGTGYARLTGIPFAPAQGGWLGNALAADRDGSLLLSLTVDEDLDGMDAGIVRVREQGTLDTSFGVNGLRHLDLEGGVRIDALALRSDRRIVATGFIQHVGSGRDVFVARLRTNGSFDSGFDGNGMARFELDPQTDSATAITFSAGKPLIAGYAERAGDYDAFVLRLQSDLIFADGTE